MYSFEKSINGTTTGLGRTKAQNVNYVRIRVKRESKQMSFFRAEIIYLII